MIKSIWKFFTGDIDTSGSPTAIISVPRFKRTRRCEPHCSHGGCLCCHRRWCEVDMKYHITDDGAGSGAFPLCEECWSSLTPETRLPYYRQLWDQWRGDLYQCRMGPKERMEELARIDARWPLIQTALADGK